MLSEMDEPPRVPGEPFDFAHEVNFEVHSPGLEAAGKILCYGEQLTSKQIIMFYLWCSARATDLLSVARRHFREYLNSASAISGRGRGTRREKAGNRT